MKKYLFLLLVAVATILASCSKNDHETSSSLENNILYFETIEEFNSELEKVVKMNESEILEWEEEKGFKSFNQEAEDLYRNIDPQKFKSEYEVKQFVEKNNKFLKLTVDPNGEYELDIQLNNTPLKYIANNDGLFQIGNSIYKVFNEGVVSLDEQRTDDLKNSDFASAILLSNHNMETIKEWSLKSISNSCYGTTVRSDNDSERIRLTLSHIASEIDNTGVARVGYYYEIRPFHKFLGIWYYAKRVISYDLNMEIIVNSQSYFLDESEDGKDDYAIESLVYFGGAYINNILDSRIKSYDSWAKQENTNMAYALCSE
jgi:hypothetical protein